MVQFRVAGARPLGLDRGRTSANTLVLAGITVGTIAALAVAKWIAALLFGTEPTDPATFAGMVLLLSAVAFTACGHGGGGPQGQPPLAVDVAKAQRQNIAIVSRTLHAAIPA